MSRLAMGVLDGDVVRVEDPGAANRLHNKGFVGTPQPGNALTLTLVEAAYVLETGRLALPGLDLAGLLAHAATQGDRTEVHYLAYRDLRDRGLVVRPRDADTYHVWRRGEGPKQEPWFHARPQSERSPVRVGDLVDFDGIVSVVDEDGGVTHYEVAPEYPSGEVLPGILPEADGTLLDDRVLVTGSEASAAFRTEFIGTPHGDGLVLSLTEAESLRRRGVLRVPGDLWAHATKRQHHFVRTFPVHEALRSLGVVAKSGFRFGTHLRGYSKDPDAVHAEWLVQCQFPDDVLHWSELSRAVRVSHGVRKCFCLAVVTSSGVRFRRLAWFRP